MGSNNGNDLQLTLLPTAESSKIWTDRHDGVWVGPRALLETDKESNTVSHWVDIVAEVTQVSTDQSQDEPLWKWDQDEADPGDWQAMFEVRR